MTRSGELVRVTGLAPVFEGTATVHSSDVTPGSVRDKNTPDQKLPNSVHFTVSNTYAYIEDASEEVLDLIEDATSYCKDDQIEMTLTASEVRRSSPIQGHWDGFYRFLKRPKLSKPYLPAGLRYKAFAILDDKGIPYTVTDLRQIPEDKAFDLKASVSLWKYQEEAVNALVAEGDAVIVMPPRAGKTMTMMETVRRLGLRTIWIAPTSSIVEQTIEVGKKFLGAKYVTSVSSGDWEEKEDTFLTVTTAAGAMNLPSAFWESRNTLVCDEVHHFLANGTWGAFLRKHTKHIYHRKGMSGTFFRSRGDDIALHAFLSHVAYSISTKELVDMGRLVPTKLYFIKPAGKSIGYCRTFTGPDGAATKGICNSTARNETIIRLALTNAKKERKVLIIVPMKKHGHHLQEEIKANLPGKLNYTGLSPVEFVSTDSSKKKIEQVFNSFRDPEGAVKILIGTTIVGEGIDLPSADCLIYASGGKAAVTYVQALFRVCTAYEGKKDAVVYDFSDTHQNMLLKHSRARWAIAKDYPVFDLEYIEDKESLFK